MRAVSFTCERTDRGVALFAAWALVVDRGVSLSINPGLSTPRAAWFFEGTEMAMDGLEGDFTNGVADSRGETFRGEPRGEGRGEPRGEGRGELPVSTGWAPREAGRDAGSGLWIFPYCFGVEGL